MSDKLTALLDVHGLDATLCAIAEWAEEKATAVESPGNKQAYKDIARAVRYCANTMPVVSEK